MEQVQRGEAGVRAQAHGQSFEQFKAEFRPVGGDGELLQVWQERQLARQPRR